VPDVIRIFIDNLTFQIIALRMSGFRCVSRHRILDQAKYNEAKYAQYQQNADQGEIFKEKDFEHCVLLRVFLAFV